MKRAKCFLMIMLLVLSCMLSIEAQPLMVKANDTSDVALGNVSDPISVIFSGTDGRITVIENASGMTWSNGISGGGDILTINTVTRIDNYNLTARATTQNGYSITVELKLDSSTGDLWVELSNETASIPNGILYPYAFFPSDGLGNAVIPINEGYLFPTTETSAASKIGIPVLSHRRMEWFGGTDSDNNKSWICILETPDDVYLNGSTTVLSNGNSYLGGVPKWIGSNNNSERTPNLLSYKRKVRFHFFPSGGYVGLAKYFREYASDKGWVKTLNEKNGEDPEHKTDKIIGAPIFYLWGDGRSITMLNELRDAGIDKAMTNVSVNQLDQYKAFPSNESSENDVWAKAAREQGYVPGFYDIYQAITSGKPKYDGTVYLWPENANPDWFYVDAAGNRHAREVSQGKAYPFARDIRVPAHVNQFDIDAYLFDTTCAAAMKFEDYDPLHPASRGDDIINRRNLLNAGYDNPNILRRLITGSEQARSWAVPYLHWAEGVSWLGSIDIQGKIPQNDLGRWNDVTYPAIMTDPIDVYDSLPENNKLSYLLSNSYEIPLWELVYHDCMVTTQHWERTHNKYVYGWDKADMMAMLRGQAPIMNLTYQGEQGQANRTPEVVIDSYGNRWSTLWLDKDDPTNFVRNRVLQTYNNVSKWHEQVGYMEMTDHKILTADYSVQMSEFSSDEGNTGKGIIINFGVYDGEYGMAGSDWVGMIRGVEYTIPVGEWVMYDFSIDYEVEVSAYVTKLFGSRNALTITITEIYDEGSTVVFSKTFRIENNAAGNYEVGDYMVYVDTKGNTQIRECYIVK